MRLIQFVSIAVFLSFASGVNAEKIEKPTWEKIAEDYAYDPPAKYKQKPKEKPKKETNIEPKKRSTGLPAASAYLLYGILGLAFIALVVAIIKSAGPRNKKIELRKTYDEENPDELVLTELERELQDAAEVGNFNRCLRYQFLLLLERLESTGIIVWHKHKTNGEYLNEALALPQYKRLRQLTLVYEYYWYGEHILSEARYHKLEQHFAQLRKELGDE